MNTNPSVVGNARRVFVANPTAAPTQAGQVVVLFATHPRKPGGSGTAVASTYVRSDGTSAVSLATDAIKLMHLTIHQNDQASAANGLRAYQTTDAGRTWVETDMKGYNIAGTANQPSIGAAAPIQVPALSTGQEWAEDFDISRYRGFALELTAGATPPTSWSYTVAIEHAQQDEV